MQVIAAQASAAYSDICEHCEQRITQQFAVTVELIRVSLMPTTINLQLTNSDYPIIVDGDLNATSLAQRLAQLGKDKYALLVDSNVEMALGLELFAQVPELVPIRISAGEQEKNLGNVERVIGAMLQARLNRNSAMICFGGGVVGDLGGFCAASFMRGIDFVQIPTTLLAQVDAAIGGKTGVNHPLGKNMIGAFHQPRTVLINPNLLSSLPKREFNAGMAEVIKAGLLYDADFFHWLETNSAAIKRHHPATLEQTIARAAEIKTIIVEQDELEQSDTRAWLNLGHTFAHALETEYDYTRYLHGEAVAIGLNAAAYCSAQLGHITPEHCTRIASLCSAFDLPTNCPDANAESLIKHMLLDKKNRAARLTLVLLRQLGAAYVEPNLSPERVLQMLRQFQHN